MKYFVVFAIICASIAFSEVAIDDYYHSKKLYFQLFQQALTKEQRIEMFKGIANECAGKEGATAADVDEAMARKMPSTRSANCLQACIGETLGVVSLLPTNSMSISI